MIDDDKTFVVPNHSRTAKPSRWTACLIVLEGCNVGNKIALNKDMMTIGRAKEVDVCLPQEGVSRVHAAIERLDGQRFLLTDKNSTNGTLVNLQPIIKRVLKDQDVINIGGSVLKFIAADSPEQPYYEELYRQAHLDKALQIYNKHYFLNKLEQEISTCQLYRQILTLMLFDIDHFKRLNDTYGHLTGDAVLVELVNLTKQQLRENDIFCRYGGEEFAIIMPNTDLAQASQLCETIRSVVEKTPIHYSGNVIEITISLGISHYAAHDNVPAPSVESLIAQADKALYSAKHQGRNKVVLFNNNH